MQRVTGSKRVFSESDDNNNNNSSSVSNQQPAPKRPKIGNQNQIDIDPNVENIDPNAVIQSIDNNFIDNNNKNNINNYNNWMSNNCNNIGNAQCRNCDVLIGMIQDLKLTINKLSENIDGNFLQMREVCLHLD